MKIIQILGYSLSEDNKATPILRERLFKAKEIITNDHKDNIIIVSGGNPIGKPERNQAQFMKKWLLENGIQEKNVVVEDKSWNTVEQLLFLYDYISQRAYITDVCIVGTEGGFQKRIQLLADNIFPNNIQITVEGSKLPEDITENEREQFTKGEELRLHTLKDQIQKLDPSISPVKLLREMAERYRSGDDDYFKEMNYEFSSGKLATNK